MVNFPCRQCAAAIHDPAWRFCPYWGGPLTGPFDQGRTTAPPLYSRRRIPASLRVAGLLLLLIAAAAFMQISMPLPKPVPITANASAVDSPATSPGSSPPTMNRSGDTTGPETLFNPTRIAPVPSMEPPFTGPIISMTGTSPSPDQVPSMGSSPEVPVINATSLEARVHERVNQVRQEHGLSVLGTGASLASLARAHSTDMASHGYFGHVNLHEMDATARGAAAGYSCHKAADPYYTSAIAENLYATYRYSSVVVVDSGETLLRWTTEEAMANETVNAWMNSPDHRANILDPGMRREGIGVAFGPGDMVFVTEDFC